MGLVANADGIFFISDTAAHCIRKITPGGTIGIFTNPYDVWGTPVAVPYASTAFAGSADVRGHRDGDPRFALFSSPAGLALDAAGNCFVVDSGNRVIRKMSASGEVTTLAGTPGQAGSADGVGGDARFGGRSSATLDANELHYFPAPTGPIGIAVDATGNVFVADTWNHTLRKITPAGVVTTIGGAAGSAGSADGGGGTARFKTPYGIAVDAAGNLYVVDTGNHTIRKGTPAYLPRFATQPQAIAGIAQGQNLALTVAVSGTPTPTIQWSKDGTPISGATSATFAIPSVQPGDAGAYTVAARNELGTATSTAAVVTINRAPTFSTQPTSVATLVGQTVTLTALASGTPAPTYLWFKDGTALSGATNATFTITSAQAGDTGEYTLAARNELGTATSTAAVVTVNRAPTFSTQPASVATFVGQTVTLTALATGTPAPTYLWFKDGTALSGATNATLTIASAQAGDAGEYTVRAVNAAGTLTCPAATVAVNTGRIANLSIRSALVPAAPALTVGFVVAGSGKPLLARGIGPALTQFGVGGALTDPRIALFGGATNLAANDNWGTAANAAQIAATAARVGAFALATGSADAALLSTFDGGAYSAQISGPNNATGVVLVELYDTDATTASRLVNVSTRAQVGAGDNVLVAGFVLTGNTRKTLLIRAVGPTLGAFGVPNTIADPRLDLIADGAVLFSNDNWGGTAELTAAFNAQGAFPFPNANSRDAALLATLDPGAYSVKVSGVGGATGEALVEIYEVR